MRGDEQCFVDKHFFMKVLFNWQTQWRQNLESTRNKCDPLLLLRLKRFFKTVKSIVRIESV